MPGTRARRPRVGLEGLHEHAAGRVAAAAAGELRHELERPLLGPEVRHAEARVRVDDGGERTPAKWWPLATICVPRARPGPPRRSARASRRARPALPADVRVETEPLELGKPRARARASRRCVPAPIRARSTEPHAGHALRRRLREPAVMAAERVVARGASAPRRSCGQRRVTPQARQWIAGATPRRLRRRIAFPPSSTSLPSAARSGAESGYPASRRRSTTLHRRERRRRSARRARAARGAPSSRVAASRCRRPPPRPRARRALRRPCARRSGDRTPACRPRRAPRRRRSARAAASARRRPTARRRRSGASPARCARARRAARPRSSHEWRIGDALAEARPEAAERLRGERDLGDEHDRAEPALERVLAGLEVDLRLPASGGAVEQECSLRLRRAPPRSGPPPPLAVGGRRGSVGGGAPLALPPRALPPVARASRARPARARARESSRSSPPARARGRRAAAGCRRAAARPLPPPPPAAPRPRARRRRRARLARTHRDDGALREPSATCR